MLEDVEPRTVMVARGDLGVEMTPEDAHHAEAHVDVQDAGKPTIIATQMLER